LADMMPVALRRANAPANQKGTLRANDTCLSLGAASKEHARVP
jgi:hypothetical protein